MVVRVKHILRIKHHFWDRKYKFTDDQKRTSPVKTYFNIFLRISFSISIEFHPIILSCFTAFNYP